MRASFIHLCTAFGCSRACAQSRYTPLSFPTWRWGMVRAAIIKWQPAVLSFKPFLNTTVSQKTIVYIAILFYYRASGLGRLQDNVCALRRHCPLEAISISNTLLLPQNKLKPNLANGQQHCTRRTVCISSSIMLYGIKTIQTHTPCCACFCILSYHAA